MVDGISAGPALQAVAFRPQRRTGVEKAQAIGTIGPSICPKTFSENHILLQLSCLLMEPHMYDSSTEVYLTGPQLRARYSVSEMTVHRWMRDPNIKFPKPMKVNSRNFWKLADIEHWERARTRKSRSAA